MRCTIFFAKKCGKKYGNFSAAKKISQIFTEFFAVRKIFCKKMRKKIRKQSQSPICSNVDIKVRLEDDKLVWPVLFLYPEKGETDFIEEFRCIFIAQEIYWFSPVSF